MIACLCVGCGWQIFQAFLCILEKALKTYSLYYGLFFPWENHSISSLDVLDAFCVQEKVLSINPLTIPTCIQFSPHCSPNIAYVTTCSWENLIKHQHISRLVITSLFLWPVYLINWWYCKEKLIDACHSWGLKGSEQFWPKKTLLT